MKKNGSRLFFFPKTVGEIHFFFFENFSCTQESFFETRICFELLLNKNTVRSSKTCHFVKFCSSNVFVPRAVIF